jgi:hypothetical protein
LTFNGALLPLQVFLPDNIVSLHPNDSRSIEMYHHSTLGLTTPQQSRRQQDFSVNSLSNGVYNAQITSSGVPKTSDYAQLVSSTARQGSVHREGKGSTYGGRKVMISSRSVSSFVSETRSTREGTRWEAYTCDESIIEGYSRGGGHRQAAKDRRPQGQSRLALSLYTVSDMIHDVHRHLARELRSIHFAGVVRLLLLLRLLLRRSLPCTDPSAPLLLLPLCRFSRHFIGWNRGG